MRKKVKYELSDAWRQQAVFNIFKCFVVDYFDLFCGVYLHTRLTGKDWLRLQVRNTAKGKLTIEQIFERHCRRQEDINRAFDKQDYEMFKVELDRVC